MSSGLILIDPDNRRDLCRKIELIEGLEYALLQRHEDRQQILEGYFAKAPSPLLMADDFQHISQDFDLLRDYMTEVNTHQRQGGNILIYGPTGTGKTQLVRVLATPLDSRSTK